ncbi:hypothetical protein J2X31_001864 [Flavobacterium arsenatis]|uniref:Uncharacterized protein n=1 Tax=Flavobacterium arsenatis TaxID=1484332 RepID=A0ABU1TPE8_9FLAO|nr:hypothetical protein [Flavobacterium arsenatis]MDR6967850.1 hypothetical protein [Flavobacterium arsenatis]
MKKLIVLFLLFGFAGYSQNVQDSTYFKITPSKYDWSKLDVSDITFKVDMKHFKDVSMVSVYDMNSIFNYDYIQNQGNYTSQRVTANPVCSFLAGNDNFYYSNTGDTLGFAFMGALFNAVFK